MDWYAKFNKLREHLGDDTLIIEILNYFSSYDIEEFCDYLVHNYNLEDD